MSTAANIRFLEKKGYKFIISYRAKTGGNEFKTISQMKKIIFK
ncbi:hypothetical protein NWE58_04365 [Mycoplasmopsis felis]|nr:hypothetical protein [Mycoplasmopsis felis]UWV83542.1 hypothetical protein NWE58_04365 [Mycoplasmopsis felis]